jgi:hypothetical protein
MSMVAVALLLTAFSIWRFYRAHHGSVPVGSLAGSLPDSTISREEVISIARSYAEHRWQAGAPNIRHGPDPKGIEVQTPDATTTAPPIGRWQIAVKNVGLPYKWGGFDTLQTFDAGVQSGKAAGDLYSPEKRRRGNAAVSDDAVGIDCSGFISRCWGLRTKFGTARLPGLCSSLPTSDALLPGDIMDAPNGHVVLFARWLDASKSRALFYEAEAEPQPRVVASEHRLLWLRLCGAQPYRYLRIRD